MSRSLSFLLRARGLLSVTVARARVFSARSGTAQVYFGTGAATDLFRSAPQVMVAPVLPAAKLLASVLVAPVLLATPVSNGYNDQASNIWLKIIQTGPNRQIRLTLQVLPLLFEDP